jgi:hypothetical protein
VVQAGLPKAQLIRRFFIAVIIAFRKMTPPALITYLIIKLCADSQAGVNL